MPLRTANTPMYEADVEVARKHQLFGNGLAQGVPVLMKGCGRYFEAEPFSAEAMFAIAKSTWGGDNPVRPCMTGGAGLTPSSSSPLLRLFFAQGMAHRKDMYAPLKIYLQVLELVRQSQARGKNWNIRYR